jgi:ABC-type branched-subunit amino acid transport system substrate-binding protein
MLLPLAGFGQTAVVAKAMKQAGELALFEIDNPSVQLVVKDDKGTAEGARAAASEAISEGAEIILGPLLSQSVPGAAHAARAAGVPVVAFSNDRQVAGQGVYLMSFLAEPEIERVVSYSLAQGKRRFAALIPDDAYGRAVEPIFRSAVERGGGSISGMEFYPVEANGMVEPAKRIMAAIKSADEQQQPVDALFVPGGPEQLPQLGPLIAYSGIDKARVKLIGTGTWEFPNIGRDETFVGGWYPGPDPRGFSDFSQRFAKTFGSSPPRIASLAHDAVTMAVSLSSHQPGTRYTVENLTRAAGFPGVDGTVRFTRNGLSERNLAILEVQSFGSTVVEPPQGQALDSRMSQAGGRIQ